MGDGNVKQKLPPGFRFCPTDEELVLHFLYPRAYLVPSHHPNINIIPHLDLSLLHPWELNGKALSSENQYYLFTKEKENRVTTANGFWKQVGHAEPVFSAANKKVGIKKNLIFNIGEPPFDSATETSWVMQEYHLCLSPFTTDESQWILCRVFEIERNTDSEDVMCYYNDDDDSGTDVSWLDELLIVSLDDDDHDHDHDHDHDLQEVTGH